MGTLSRRLFRSTAAGSLLGYVAVFAVLTHAWWSTATYAVAPGNDPRDARLIVWILGWVAHALAHTPTRVFDAPIFFPAPGQLAGSEHLLTAQVVFAPIYWTTGNAVLAANATALLSYPAAAFAMERLLAAQRLGRGAAWFGGLTFALGVLRVPASLQVLQYVTLFLPLVALRIQRLRERPRARESVLLTACLLAGMFSSYYLAVLLVVTTAVWGAFELARCESNRARFVALAGAALLGASVLLVSASGAYLHRSTAPVVDVLSTSPEGFWGRVGWSLLAAALHDPVWLGLAALALAGATASLRGRASRRALAATSLAFIVIGVALLAVGWPWGFSRWLGFFRVRTRYLLLSSFGFSLLVAQGFDALRSRLSFRSGGTLLLASLTASLVFARLGAVAPRSDAVLAISRDRALYRRLGEIVRGQGGGPLLEVPYVSSPMAHSAPEAMIGQLEHGAPLIVGFTAYRPDHHALLLGLIAGLPAASAVDDLIDLTHLRWILVRPPDEWPDAAVRQRFLDGLGRYPARGPSWTIGPWVLQRLDRIPGHHTWFDWLAAGPQPGHSVLGTSLEAIPERDAIAAISARVGPGTVFSRSFVGVAVAATNRGTAAWPTWVAGGSSERGLVRWNARWRRVDGSRAEWGPPTTAPLRRDVPPNETLAQSIVLGTPEEPGSYELRIAVAQQDGARFSAPGNDVAILRLDLATPR